MGSCGTGLLDGLVEIEGEDVGVTVGEALGVIEDVALGEIEGVAEGVEIDGSLLGVTVVVTEGERLVVIEGDTVGVSEFDSDIVGVTLALLDGVELIVGDDVALELEGVAENSGLLFTVVPGD